MSYQRKENNGRSKQIRGFPTERAGCNTQKVYRISLTSRLGKYIVVFCLPIL